MNLRFIDWIWHVRGSLPLAPQQSSEEAFAKLAPLFREVGTSHERASDTLTFRKKDQAAQDKMSVFDSGVLQIETTSVGSVLRYDLISRSLLFCFLAPLLFLGFAQLTIAMGNLEKSSAKAESAAEKASDAAKKSAEKKAEMPMNPIDKALGAPPPEKPKKDGADKEKDKKHSPTAAYVFAAIFATLYVIGRFLEDRLIKTLFKKSLLGT
ncbi:hypothetical protein WSK_3726 [Novosphingobium sp. Rr 2-17]|uniref:hypothetical protein n=1 Tax=Novosphingobium sp. Rr 2-17 TaxID=555793 RepID=UPI000269824F|nr:hypothetical protein [Novosphingobium sp. Rr 2-17]EIZ77716.1 hypothetical protein WSK_3726 [Novosphingobium sp. Rr 2-17]